MPVDNQSPSNLSTKKSDDSPCQKQRAADCSRDRAHPSSQHPACVTRRFAESSRCASSHACVATGSRTKLDKTPGGVMEIFE
jgi:hypothetical protein